MHPIEMVQQGPEVKTTREETVCEPMPDGFNLKPHGRVTFPFLVSYMEQRSFKYKAIMGLTVQHFTPLSQPKNK